MTGEDAQRAARGRVRLSGIEVGYGGRTAVHHVSLEVAPGEFVCLLGPSGCGKTTTLRAIAGLVGIQAGSIEIDGQAADHLPAHRRRIAMVFQDLALFPHMTVHENVAFGLALQRLDAGTIRQRVSAMLAMLHLDGFDERLPRELSGGQQQRVAIARSLVVNPSVLLLDEPFASLDRKLREEMRREIRSLQRRLGITVVFVTHDQEEALAMSDRVVVMNLGRIEQIGMPSEVYENPASRFVMGFVGLTNFLRVEAVRRAGAAARCRLAGVEITLATSPIAADGSQTAPELAIRPERLRLAPEATTALGNRVPGTVRNIAYEGGSITHEIELADGQLVITRAQNLGIASHAPGPRIGERVIVAWGDEDARLIEAAP
jgi:putative spermidine/putrescine transport system ATP-binding protein